MTLSLTTNFMDALRGQYEEINEHIRSLKAIPTFNPFLGYNDDIDNFTDKTSLDSYNKELQSIHVILENFNDKRLKEIAMSTSNKKLSKEDTDYLEVVLQTISSFESAVQLVAKKHLNLQLTHFRLIWDQQREQFSKLITNFSFLNSDRCLPIAIDILHSSSNAVDEMVDLNKVPEALLDEQDRLENSLNQLISLIQVYKTLLHHLYLDSWLHTCSSAHQFEDLNSFQLIIENSDTLINMHPQLHTVIDHLEQIRCQSRTMTSLKHKHDHLLDSSPSKDSLSQFAEDLKQINYLPCDGSELFSQINNQVKYDASNFLEKLNSEYVKYTTILDINKQACTMLKDQNPLGPLPTRQFHSTLIRHLDGTQSDAAPLSELKRETKGNLDGLSSLSTSKDRIDEADKILSQLLNAIDHHESTQELQTTFDNVLDSLPNLHDKRVSHHVNRLKSTYEEINEMILDDDSASTSQRSLRLRSSSIESSSSALSSLSLIDYNKPRERTLSSTSTHRRLFEVTHDEDIPPVPPLPSGKDWSASLLNLPGPTPRPRASSRSKGKGKPITPTLKPPVDVNATPVRKHSLTKATMMSISRRKNRAVSNPMPSKAPTDENTAPKRVLSSSSSASSLKPPATIDATPSRKAIRKRSSTSLYSHSSRSPRRSLKNVYKANPKSKLDLAVGRIVNSLPLSVKIERAKGATCDSGKYWIGAPDPKLCFCRILRSSTVMVRVGGGWEELSKFLLTHFSHLFDTNNHSSNLLQTPSKDRTISQSTYSPSSHLSPTPSPFMSPYK
ncbi:hypothetical protein E3Q14_01066 [Wallemia mellicola]|nr:hypothetical protein E3Q14_01066 [Wallemia mellicola]